MDRLLEIAFTNAGYAALIAAVAALVERWLSGPSPGAMRWPSVVRGVWMLVLLRLLVPPLFELGLPILPASALPAGALTKSSFSETSFYRDAGLAAPSYFSVSEIAGVLWLAGALAVLALTLARTAVLRRWLGAAKPVCRDLAVRVSELSGRMGIPRPPEISAVDATVPPMLWSAFGRSRLILPAALLRRTSAMERDALIVHELAHLRRRDHWARYLELAAVLIFWWHPAAWWACRRLRRAEERCCDAVVAETLPGHRRAYADGLLKTLRHLSGTRLPGYAPASGAGELNDLEGRLTMIMTHQTRKPFSPTGKMLLATVMLALLAVYPTLAQREPPSSRDSVYSGRPIDLDVKHEPVGNVLRTLAAVSGLNFIIEPGTDLSVPATVNVTQVPWDEMLARVLSANGFAFSVEGNVVWIGPADRAWSTSRPFVGEPIDLQLAGVDLRKALRELSNWTNLEIELAPGIQGKVTVELVDVPWDQALDAILRINGLEVTRKGAVLEVHAPKH